jgi:hypothetical protein
MKLDTAQVILALMEAGGIREEGGYYVVRDRNGLFHRDDGPALVHPDGAQYWCQNGLFHRDDGPAVVHPDGRQEWWRAGRRRKTQPCHSSAK